MPSTRGWSAANMPRPPAHRISAGRSPGYPDPVEQFFAALLVLVVAAIGWFACYVVYRLFIDNR